MTNAEKYLKEGINKEELFSGIANAFFGECSECDKARLKNFFYEEIKPTEDEKVILRNIKNDEFGKYIGRGDSTRENTPTYSNLYLRGDDESKAYAIGTIYSHLFQFIKERRRI